MLTDLSGKYKAYFPASYFLHKYIQIQTENVWTVRLITEDEITQCRIFSKTLNFLPNEQQKRFLAYQKIT